MNQNICPNCDNFMFTYINPETKELYNGCKSCGYKKNNDSEFVYKSDSTLDVSKIVNTNELLTSDITIPSIKNNPNIKCINSDCKSIIEDLPCDIKYIKYNKSNMLFMYCCSYCGVKWKNN